jgi:ribonuclease J
MAADGKWLMVDLGMTFSDPDYPGRRTGLCRSRIHRGTRKDLFGIVLTHAHEDHIGAVPYFAAELGVPLYATPFTAGWSRASWRRQALLDRGRTASSIISMESFHAGAVRHPLRAAGAFDAEGNALLIDTPYGRIFHTGDWKLDDEPLIGTPATAEN